MRILLAIIVIAFVCWVIVEIASRVASPEKREARKTLRNDAEALRNERERSTLAQNALREISAGAEYPIFVASDALSNINKTYSKEITK